MLRITIFLATLFLSFSLNAQLAVLRGEVIDMDTGEPLIGATLVNGQYNTITEIDGTYEIQIVEGQNNIFVSYIGYGDFPLLVIGNGTDKILDVRIGQTNTILEQATITGSRYEKSLGKSPVAINVIKPELVESTNTTIITSLLDKVPGVQMVDGQANIRGGSGFSYGAGSRVLLLIDDVPAFQSDAGRPLWDDIPVENIAQIEVLKGASSAIYGSSALNGVINVRTGYAKSEPETKASAAYTFFMAPQDARKQWWGTAPYRYNLGLTHKQKFNKLDVVAAGFYEESEDFYRGKYKDRYRLSTNLKYRFSEKLSLAVNAMYNYKDDSNFLLWDNARAGAYLGWESGFIQGVTKRFYIDPQLSFYDNKLNKHKLTTRYYWINNGSTTNQATNSNNLFAEYQYTGKSSQLGLDYTLGASAYLASTNSELYGNIDLDANNYAAYLQLEKSFSDRLILTVGTRMEMNQHIGPDLLVDMETLDGNVFDSKLVSRFGLNYEVTKYTFLRASWGQGYRFPTIAERYTSNDLGSFSIIPNFNLQSESGWTSEIGIKQGFKIKDWEGYVDLSLFRSEYTNMMEFTFGSFNGVSGFQSQNVGNTVINGAEVNVIGRSKLFGLPTNLLLGYTYIDPKYKDFETNTALRTSLSLPTDPDSDPNVLKYRTKHNFKFDLETEIKSFNVGVAVNVTSNMVTIDQFLSMLNEINQYRAINGGFTRVDLRVGYKLKSWKASVVAQNLLNSEFAIRPGILEAPRNISFRIDKSF